MSLLNNFKPGPTPLAVFQNVHKSSKNVCLFLIDKFHRMKQLYEHEAYYNDKYTETNQTAPPHMYYIQYATTGTSALSHCDRNSITLVTGTACDLKNVALTISKLPCRPSVKLTQVNLQLTIVNLQLTHANMQLTLLI